MAGRLTASITERLVPAVELAIPITTDSIKDFITTGIGIPAIGTTIITTITTTITGTFTAVGDWAMGLDLAWGTVLASADLVTWGDTDSAITEVMDSDMVALAGMGSVTVATDSGTAVIVATVGMEAMAVTAVA